MPKLVTKRRESRMATYLNAVQRIHGPAMPNPYRECREHLDLTLMQVASSAGISKQALIRLEQGVPVTPVDAVTLFYLDRREDLNYSDLVNVYEKFQKEMRYRHSRIFGDIPTLATFAQPHNLPIHPFELLLTTQWTNPETGEHLGPLNNTEFAKLLCFPQSVSDHWLNKVNRQQSVPKQLIAVLHQAGYSNDELTVLSNAYTNHRNYVVHGQDPIVSDVVAPRPVGARGSAAPRTKGSSNPSSPTSTAPSLLELIKQEALG